jgi:hypothetical protein
MDRSRPIVMAIMARAIARTMAEVLAQYADIVIAMVKVRAGATAGAMVNAIAIA